MSEEKGNGGGIYCLAAKNKLLQMPLLHKTGQSIKKSLLADAVWNPVIEVTEGTKHSTFLDFFQMYVCKIPLNSCDFFFLLEPVADVWCLLMF